jgi:glycosyltransferase involved in cell wall biosynthesis
MPGGPNSIAVIIPTYNSMKYFRETLDSVFLQTLPPDEVLVNDDGSIDGTPDFAERYGAEFSAAHGRPVPPVRVFRRGGQRQTGSRNYAAGQTACEWIAFLDHDDLWEPHKLARQMAELAAHPEADLCYSSLVTFTQEGDRIEIQTTPLVPPASGIRKALFHSTTFLPSGVVVRRKAFLATGGFDTKYRVAEDWELWMRMLNSGMRFAAVEEPLVKFRIHPNNQSRNALASLDEAMDVYRRHVLPQHPPATRWLQYARTRSAHESSAAQAMRHNKDPQCKWMMLRSIARFPFNDLPRYKMFAHMLLKGPR